MISLIDITRKLFKKKGYKKFVKVLSLIGDLVHLDFRSIKNVIKNKEGVDKGVKLATEIGLLLQVLKNEDIPWYDYDPNLEPELFDDIEQYGIDVNLILNTLEDPIFKTYLENDKRFKKGLEGKYKGIIELLKRFRDWKTGR